MKCKSNVYPLAMPKDLGNEIRAVARAAGVSDADIMRLAMQRGLPELKVFFVKRTVAGCACGKEKAA